MNILIYLNTFVIPGRTQEKSSSRHHSFEFIFVTQEEQWKMNACSKNNIRKDNSNLPFPNI